MNDNTAMVVADQPPQSMTLFRTDEPVEIVERATKVADALKSVIEKQRLFTQIQGRKHVNVEGWTLCGSLLGVFAVLEWSRPLEDGKGWEARVEARTRDGAVVGAAEAQCTRAESTWKSRDDYALRSMSQTRATSKALRQPLGFIVSLAGYDSTPVEEMPHDASEPQQARQRQQGRPQQPQPIEGEVVSRNIELRPDQQLLADTLKHVYGGLAGQISGFLNEHGVRPGNSMKATLSALSEEQCDVLIEALAQQQRPPAEEEVDARQAELV